jgi:hypothetical protein
MTKQETRMRFGGEAIKVIVSNMPEAIEQHELSAEILERYLNLIRYIAAHSMEQSSYTLGELEGMVNDYGFEFEMEVNDAVDHYIFEVNALYQEVA